MNSDLIADLLKQINPEKDKKKNKVRSEDADVNLLHSLYQIPKKESGKEMAKYQVFKEGYQQADILFLPKDNKNKYCLVVTDDHSHVTDAEPLTNKSSPSVKEAFETIYKRKILSKPISMTCDSGSEFKGEVKKYFEDWNVFIRYAETNRHKQVALVENKNKNIGGTLHKLMALIELKTGKQSNNWVKFLPDVIKTMNEHLTKPIDTQISDTPFSSNYNKDLLTEGSIVRVKLDHPISLIGESRLHGTFRSSDIRWSKDTYPITNIIFKPGYPVMYQVGDEKFTRSRNEIQLVTEKEYN